MAAVLIVVCSAPPSTPAAPALPSSAAVPSASAANAQPSPSASVTASLVPRQPRGMPTTDDVRLVRALVEFARIPESRTLAAIPLANRVRLGLSSRLITERASFDLARREAWVLPGEVFRGRVGPFSALDLVARDVPMTIAVGPHAHCASPPVPPPMEVVGLRRVSVQPKDIDTCLLWWTVDLFVSAAGRIEAITLDLWDP